MKEKKRHEKPRRKSSFVFSQLMNAFFFPAIAVALDILQLTKITLIRKMIGTVKPKARSRMCVSASNQRQTRIFKIFGISIAKTDTHQ